MTQKLTNYQVLQVSSQGHEPTCITHTLGITPMLISLLHHHLSRFTSTAHKGKPLQQSTSRGQSTPGLNPCTFNIPFSLPSSLAPPYTPPPFPLFFTYFFSRFFSDLHVPKPSFADWFQTCH